VLREAVAMNPLALRLGVLFLLIPFVGCQLCDPTGSVRAHLMYTPAQLREMERCLPEGLTLETRFAPKGIPFVRDTITIREKLLELRAYCKDGKLFDAVGKELYFYHVPEYGTPPPPGLLEGQGKYRQMLDEHYHVIDMYAPIGPC
jgi:hypothetical protein